MNISSCSRTRSWPTYSPNAFGRRARSMDSSLGDAVCGATIRSCSNAALSESECMIMVSEGEKVICTALYCHRTRVFQALTTGYDNRSEEHKYEIKSLMRITKSS